MYEKFRDYPLMNNRKGSVPLFYHHIPNIDLGWCVSVSEHIEERAVYDFLDVFK